ncbi:unnamed protein product [Durusdinium trenchii]|uniref:ATP-dependent RNA helicase n=1 Tax=Durusdinium trenchii TaxID=1381693 RepID=A0ABP0PR60_9DINO
MALATPHASSPPSPAIARAPCAARPAPTPAVRASQASSLAAASVVTLWVVRRRGRSATAPQRSRVSALAPELVKVNEGVEDEDQEDQEVANARNTRKFELWPGISDTMVDFGGLPIPQRLADAFTERGIVEPSPIQETPQVMPKLARGEHVIIHALTGGGKTLGYLLPLLARLQPTMHVGLQALLFVPTAELALQVGRELKWLIYVLAGGAEGMCWFNPQVPQEIACQVLLSRSNLWDAVRQDASIMVTTPGLIRSELQMLKWEARRFSETLKLFLASNLHTIITDEVDALTPLQSTVAKGPEKVGAAERVSAFVLDEVRSRYRNRPVQLVVSSATANSRKVAASLDRLIQRKYPKRRDRARRQPPELVQAEAEVLRVAAPSGQTRRRAEGPDAASTGAFVPMPKGIRHCLALVEDRDNGLVMGQPRYTAMASIVRNLKGSGHVLVFVPERVKLDAMVMLLKRAGIANTSKYRSEVGLGVSTEQLMDNDFQRKPKMNSSYRGRPAEQSINPLLALQQYQDVCR